jgi:hypothetical protein
MIEVQGGITIGPGITMGAVSGLPAFIVTETDVQIVTEDNNIIIED